MLVKSSFEQLIEYNKGDQQLFFRLKAISKKKSDIRLQYLVYNIIHTNANSGLAIKHLRFGISSM